MLTKPLGTDQQQPQGGSNFLLLLIPGLPSYALCGFYSITMLPFPCIKFPLPEVPGMVSVVPVGFLHLHVYI